MATQTTQMKRWRNVVVLVILSLIMMGGCSLCNFLTIAPLNNIITSLIDIPPAIQPIWGIVIGIISIALLWLGAGIATVLVRLPNVALRVLVSLVIFAGVPLVLIILFAGPSLLMWLPTVSDIPNWNTLKPVPGRAVEFVDADINNVYVQTETGKILHCATAVQEECWGEVDSPITIMEKTRRIPLSPRLDPPENTLSTLGVAYDATAETGVEVYYALLMDGTVMWWQHESAHPYMILFGWLYPLLIVLGIVALFVPLYLGAAIVGLKRMRGRRYPA